MANALYTKGKQKLLDAVFDCNGHTLKAVLVASEHYTPNLATDDELADIAEVAATATLANVTITDGVLDADDTTFSAVTYPHNIDYLAIYDDSVAGDPLLILDDDVSGFPFTPNGGDIRIQWSNGADKICRLN